MEHSDSHRYAASVDAVMAMWADGAAIKARYEGMGHRDVEIRECTHDATSLHVVSARVVDVELPGFAKKVLKPTNRMVQVDDWHADADGDGWNGTFDVTVDGAPVKISGTMRLTPDGDGCRHAVAIRVDVKVPLVGGKIADWVGKNDVRRTLTEEFAAGDRWLAGHR